MKTPRLMSDGKAKGRPRSALDAIIAAVPEANEWIVVTDNERISRELRSLIVTGCSMKGAMLGMRNHSSAEPTGSTSGRRQIGR